MTDTLVPLVQRGPGGTCEHPPPLHREPTMLTDAVVPVRALVRVGAPSQVVQLHGEHDLATVGDLAVSLAAASVVPGDLIVDLSDVTFFDASTIAILVGAHLDLGADGRHLWLRSPTPWGRRLLGLCGLTPLIESSAGGVAA